MSQSIGFGRRVAKDPCDRAFPMRARLPEKPVHRSRTWRIGQILDQGATGTCVGHAWRDWFACTPITHRPTIGPTATDIYCQAIKLDEWLDNDDDCGPMQAGTSVRAGAKVMQQHGYLQSYLWAQSVDDIRLWILSHGPVVLGTNWYEGMFDPDEHHIIHPTGDIVGGHAYLAFGWDDRLGAVRIQNSWSRDWGYKGTAYILAEDLAKLLAEDGEAVAGAEIKVKQS